jgi:hypothetical protein
VADQQTLADLDPHEEIVRLEERIEELAAKLESCRKFILISRIALASGGLILAATLVGAIRSDLGFHGSFGRFISRGHRSMGFKQQHRKRDSKGDSRIRIEAGSFDRTDQSACYLIGKCSPRNKSVANSQEVRAIATRL